eukprot:TRINITY_DN4003_c0_g3_i1.p1 TRINITY_DN4003_c0_g3~~TRINITY_DN4003_c0_g3_i1.p1  ORF type:complete len:596 (-),score=76.13 TRINITY_DN4003_c0_g3_i1:97-1806(-)
MQCVTKPSFIARRPAVLRGKFQELARRKHVTARSRRMRVPTNRPVMTAYLEPKVQDVLNEVNTVDQETETERSEVSPHGLLNDVLVRCDDPTELLRTLKLHHASMNAVNVSTAALTITKLLKTRQSSSDSQDRQAIGNVYGILFQLFQSKGSEMSPRSLANCLYSVGKMVDTFPLSMYDGARVDQVFEELCLHAARAVDDMTGTGICQSVWAMGKLQYHNEYHMNKFITTAIEKKDDLKMSHIATMLLAMAYAKFNEPKLIAKLIKLIQQQYQQQLSHLFDNQIYANILWALQELRYHDKDFQLFLEKLLLEQKFQFTSQQLNNVIYNFVEFGVKNQENVLQILVDQFLNIQSHLSCNFSAFIYALSVFGFSQQQTQLIMDKYFEQNQNQLEQIDKKDIFRIKKAQFQYLSRKQNLILPPKFQEFCQNFNFSDNLHKNQFLDVVHEFVKQKYKNCQKRLIQQDGNLEIMIAILDEEAGQKVAVVPFSAYEYSINKPKKLLGRGKIYVNLLKAYGWHVIQVSALDWENGRYKNKILKLIGDSLNQEKVNGSQIKNKVEAKLQQEVGSQSC